MTSIFADKNSRPDEAALKNVLGKTFSFWKDLELHTLSCCSAAKVEWNFSGEKFGWSYRIKDSNRVIIYLLPRDVFFKVAFVFGQKATDTILGGKFSATIIKELQAAVAHKEGRGIRLEVRDKKLMDDFKKLIEIKLDF